MADPPLLHADGGMHGVHGVRVLAGSRVTQAARRLRRPPRRRGARLRGPRATRCQHAERPGKNSSWSGTPAADAPLSHAGRCRGASREPKACRGRVARLQGETSRIAEGPHPALPGCSLGAACPEAAGRGPRGGSGSPAPPGWAWPASVRSAATRPPRPTCRTRYTLSALRALLEAARLPPGQRVAPIDLRESEKNDLSRAPFPLTYAVVSWPIPAQSALGAARVQSTARGPCQ